MRMKFNRRAFSLLELVLSMVMSSLLIVSIVALYGPLLDQIIDSKETGELRNNVSKSIEAMGNDIREAAVVYIDPTLCYLLCLQDYATGNRIIYYLSGTTLYRKKESAASSVSCANGQPFLIKQQLQPSRT